MAVKKKKKGKSKSVDKADFWESLNPAKQHFIILAFLFILPLFLFLYKNPQYFLEHYI
jgi:hypothetical protein